MEGGGEMSCGQGQMRIGVRGSQLVLQLQFLA